METLILLIIVGVLLYLLIIKSYYMAKVEALENDQQMGFVKRYWWVFPLLLIAVIIFK